MSSFARATPEHDGVLQGLRSRYETEGYAFTAGPDASSLPSFLGAYRPAALAHKPGRNIAIEVRTRRSHDAQPNLTVLRRLFEGHPDWQLNVVFAGTTPASIEVPIASPAAILKRLDEVRKLAGPGHRRAAFVMLWSLLEAAVQSIENDAPTRPLAPGTIVQSLAMNGLVDGDAEARLRRLIDVRNRIVHGDVDVEPTAEDVDLMLDVLESALSDVAA